MSEKRAGLLMGMPFVQRAEIELEFSELFEDLEDAVDEVKASVRGLERLLDRTFHGDE